MYQMLLDLHFKMMKMVNFMLCVVYQNKKNYVFQVQLPEILLWKTWYVVLTSTPVI